MKLIAKSPQGNLEGILDKKFASLVNKKKCLEIAKVLELEKYVLVSNPKNKKIKIEDKVLADCLEALIGAVYLDKGLIVTEKMILNLYTKKISYLLIKSEASLKKFIELMILLQIIKY